MDSLPRRKAHLLVATSVYRSCHGNGHLRPLYLSRVEAGFPSPADDYVEASLDLNDFLIQNEAATFFVRVAGGSMTGAGIHDGDLLVVDRSVKPEDGSIVVAALDGELTVKRYRIKDQQPYLVPESDEHEPIPVRPEQDLIVWGVVKHGIHEVS